jgi:hypothetical protein
MYSRIFTFIMAMFMVGIPKLVSSTHYGYIKMYEQWFDQPYKVALWVIWLLWMLYPLTLHFQYNWHYRREEKRAAERQRQLAEKYKVSDK